MLHNNATVAAVALAIVQMDCGVFSAPANLLTTRQRLLHELFPSGHDRMFRFDDRLPVLVRSDDVTSNFGCRFTWP